MNLHRSYLHSLSVSVFVLWLFCCSTACHKKSDYSREILTLDSLQQTLRSEQEDLSHFKTIPADTVTEKLKYVQENFVGKMQHDMAITLAEFGTLRSQNSTLSEESGLLKAQGDSIIIRCSTLRQALAEHATHDALKNELTDQYVVTALNNEKKMAGDWINQSKLWKSKMSTLMQKFESQMPIVTHWTDSIQARKK